MVTPVSQSKRSAERKAGLQTREVLRQQLIAAVTEAAEKLPVQGPMNTFIHHNTLHAYEHLLFFQAVEQAAREYGSQAYLAESRYREELLRGRICPRELEELLTEELGGQGEEMVFPGCSRYALRRAMLHHPLRQGSPAELLWFVAETDALRRFRSDVPAEKRVRMLGEIRRWVLRDLRAALLHPEEAPPVVNKLSEEVWSALKQSMADPHIETWDEGRWEALTLQAMWHICCQRVAEVHSRSSLTLPERHRDLLWRVTGYDADLLVHEVLIPFCAAFADQGLAVWSGLRREQGFYRAFRALYSLPIGSPLRWRRDVASTLRRWEQQQLHPVDALLESLEHLGVSSEEWYSFLTSTLLALRGWAGMLWFLERHPARALRPVPPGTLLEYLTIRLLLERHAVEYLARREAHYRGPLSRLREELRQQLLASSATRVEQQAFVVFQLAQVLGWTPKELAYLDTSGWQRLLHEIENFSAIERRRLFHRAYERRLYHQVLDALSVPHRLTPAPNPLRPSFQALFCLDEREESLRRHVEEVAPDAVTYGLAGFFFVPMYFKGVHETHFVPQCPVAITPHHYVEEISCGATMEQQQRQQRTRHGLGRVWQGLHLGSRSLTLGALLAMTAGVWMIIPLLLRTLFPRLTARWRHHLSQLVFQPSPSCLRVERQADPPGPDPQHQGFVLSEMTDIAERVLRDVGLTQGFAPWVLLIGHGATSANNPHKSAYDCGACGGTSGGPNARVLAHMLNDPRVRQQLSLRGITIPSDTWFVCGWHNTSSDALAWYDVEQLPGARRAAFTSIQAVMDRAAELNAHERCRRFASASLTLSPAEAREHVENRTEDLAQVRTELGHATNAVCIIGRRERTRGLFLDRRAFLCSYDPTQDDPQGTVLQRILQAVLPVCAGINLEYFFSTVDNQQYGCGSKLPHNIASLLGVMDGSASDLRTGLPWQMVEIHEPVRLLCIVETTPAVWHQVEALAPAWLPLIRNGWVHLALLDPDTSELWWYDHGSWSPYRAVAPHLPQAPSSRAWYRGWREHLEFARIAPPVTAHSAPQEGT
ncbi:MAG: UPF0753 protein [Planctomycetaceae bacterium]|nr:MAG: UPF0753 protein [Planctomycetaceae bacterium]